jgi:signal transduction histidine kinase
VAYKIWLVCAVIVGLGTLAMLVVYRGLVGVRQEIRHLSDVHEPIKSAVHEMEINVKGIAIGTLAYLSAPDAAFEVLIEDAEEDFAEFHAVYRQLAVTEQEKGLSKSIQQLFERFIAGSRELRLRRDRQAASFTDALLKLEEIDKVFDQELPVLLDPTRATYPNKLQNVFVIDEGIDAIRMKAATYRWSRNAAHKTVINQRIAECEAGFERLTSFQWASEPLEGTVVAIRKEFDDAIELIGEVLVDEDEIQQGIGQFIALRESIDALLDDEMQPLADELLLRPREDAEAASAAVVVQIGWMIPLFLASAALASLMLTRTVTRPLNRLTRGTEVVGRGDLNYRVAEIGNDEFALLAQAFNRMVMQLHETLVSKELLEQSEKELQRTVQALQEEIGERIRTEDERIRLQTSLRRTQSLSVMGSLVAGVAHQVRNPLFAITSVLDAMEARLGKREDYQQYLEVLRGQVDRVARLMNELMEYGRPGSVQRIVESVQDVIRDAILACRGIAADAEVAVEVQMDGEVASLVMDRPRLGRALENLVENAIQHSSAGDTVTITASNVEEGECHWVEIRVEDRGPGFRENDLPHVFEPFFTRRQGGTGLGLALVERIVESHGGLVTAKCRRGGGAVLTVRLPVACEAVASGELTV